MSGRSFSEPFPRGLEREGRSAMRIAEKEQHPKTRARCSLWNLVLIARS